MSYMVGKGIDCRGQIVLFVVPRHLGDSVPLTKSEKGDSLLLFVLCQTITELV